MILVVDTSLGSAVAVVDGDGAPLARVASPDPLGHAEVIGELLVRVLADAGEGRIEQVVAGMGPGPFTGLRIGVAAARAFALGRGIDVVPVPSHFAPALTELEQDPVSGPFAVVTDARRREAAITVFDGLDADGIPRIAAGTVLVPRAEVDAHLDGVRALEATVLDAAALGRVGIRARRAGRALTGAEPLYLRQPDVTLPGAPKKVGA